MPVVLSAEHGGWVRLPPKRSVSPQKQAEALRSGALSYFACTPVPPPKPTKLPSFPKYDLDGYDDDIPPKARGGKAKSHQGRACSAPGPRPGHSYSRADPDEELAPEVEDEAEADEEQEEDFGYHGHNYHRHHRHHHDDAMSTRSRERVRPRRDSYSGGSSRSGESARRNTPAPAPAPAPAPGGQSKYWTGPSNKYTRRTAGSSSSSSFGRRTASERWASATQPLVF